MFSGQISDNLLQTHARHLQLAIETGQVPEVARVIQTFENALPRGTPNPNWLALKLLANPLNPTTYISPQRHPDALGYATQLFMRAPDENSKGCQENVIRFLLNRGASVYKAMAINPFCLDENLPVQEESRDAIKHKQLIFAHIKQKNISEEEARKKAYKEHLEMVFTQHQETNLFLALSQLLYTPSFLPWQLETRVEFIIDKVNALQRADIENALKDLNLNLENVVNRFSEQLSKLIVDKTKCEMMIRKCAELFDKEDIVAQILERFLPGHKSVKLSSLSFPPISQYPLSPEEKEEIGIIEESEYYSEQEEEDEEEVEV